MSKNMEVEYLEVEYLVAFTDRTWDTVTEIVDVPEDTEGDALVGYLDARGRGILLNPLAPRFDREVAMIGIYHINEDYEEGVASNGT